MSHISCMLCGLQRPIKNYDPSNFDNELYLISKRSRGYRGGFDDDYMPILGDDVYTPPIKNRILEIVRAFREKGIISDNELEGISPKKDEPKSLLDKAIERVLFQALTGTSNNSDSYIMESKVKELSDQLDKLKADYNKLGEEHIKLSQDFIESSIDFQKNILLKDLIDYILMHFLKYCDAQIGGSSLNDFKVLLINLDKNFYTLLACIYQDLSIDEWCGLMDKIHGTLQVQTILDCARISAVE